MHESSAMCVARQSVDNDMQCWGRLIALCVNLRPLAKCRHLLCFENLTCKSESASLCFYLMRRMTRGGCNCCCGVSQDICNNASVLHCASSATTPVCTTEARRPHGHSAFVFEGCLCKYMLPTPRTDLV